MLANDPAQSKDLCTSRGVTVRFEIMKREDLRSDLEQRQRNIVFPDTAENEARFWRNILSNRQKLSPVQIIGIGLVYVAMAAGFYGMISTELQTSQGSGEPLWERIWTSMGGWIVLLAIFFGALLVGSLVSKRNNRRHKQ